VACKNITTTKQTIHFYLSNEFALLEAKTMNQKAFCGDVQHSTHLILSTYPLAKTPHHYIMLVVW